MKILRSLFHKNKYEEQTDAIFSHAILTSFLGVLICCVCLAGSTWAWFSINVQSSINIESTSYDISNLTIRTADGSLITESEGKYQLENNVIYEITFVPSGAATNGYLLITNTNEQTPKQYHYVASELNEEGMATFLWECPTSGAYTFTAGWGTLLGDEVEVQPDNLANEMKEEVPAVSESETNAETNNIDHSEVVEEANE